MTDHQQARAAQRAWAHKPVRARLRILRRFRADLARSAQELAGTVACNVPGSLQRAPADTLVAEVLPLAEACRFLEQEAEFILRTRRESSHSRPFWLRSTDVAIERAPLGVVLVIGPGNYPLFLAGVQVLQALVAGNAVLWKPAATGVACAHALRAMLVANGLPAELLVVVDAAPAAAHSAIEAGVDKVILTGSAATGEAVQRALAASATPSIMELSGCDAVFVLEGAELARVVDALCFGMRLNGSATCMAPRRVFVAAPLHDLLADMLGGAMDLLAPGELLESARNGLLDLITEATLEGAHLLRDGLLPEQVQAGTVRPTLLSGVTPEMRIAQADVFAPVLSLLRFTTLEQAAAMYEQCPYALTAAIFGPEKQARILARNLTAGTILFNDVIVSTADPRASFGGRKRSGFGTTRGREGLLAMTAPRTVIRQRSTSMLPYQHTGPAHESFFAGYVQAMHAHGWRARLAGWRAMGRAAPMLRPRKH